jgi:hypothetical protein
MLDKTTKLGFGRQFHDDNPQAVLLLVAHKGVSCDSYLSASAAQSNQVAHWLQAQAYAEQEQPQQQQQGICCEQRSSTA